MQQISNVQKTFEKRMIYRSETCPIHAVQFVEFEGEAQCPKCFTEHENKALELKMNNQVEQSNSLYLERKSLLSDRTLLSSTLENYTVTSNTEADLNKQIVLECVNHLKSGQVFNIILQGKAGAGKSHLAFAILRALNSMKIKGAGDKEPVQKSCAFISFELMLRKVRESYKKPEQILNEFYFLRLIEQVDFLVIDDLGAESGAIDTEKTATDFVHKFLYALSTSRQHKVTIYTTNLTSTLLTTLYDKKLISRFFKKPKFIVFKDTKDYRIGDIPF
ncbi:ATP-binding protein [Psychrobacillus sp. OK032]|uniref:ATP-binding protein n=1 Tax=Psychrobacillus sp. OK032 TaxID=1884358 RepID=UPI0008D3B887|nr:ATP-binding protein [Psychrobacillus sp. OK032]SES34616.1 DNA replication protein DnaC [Psychrobacillus sp. OK032]